MFVCTRMSCSKRLLVLYSLAGMHLFLDTEHHANTIKAAIFGAIQDIQSF